MLVPTVGSKGSFTFSEPFNKDELQKKILEVISIRKLTELFANGDDPCNSIYVKNGLTTQDYMDDLQTDVPIAIFSSPGGYFYSIPCDRIESLPSSSGVPYMQKVLAISLGALPYDYHLEEVINNINDVLIEKLALKTRCEIIDASATFYKSYEEHDAFERWMETNPLLRGSKSYRIKYEELLEKFNALKLERDRLVTFMKNTWTTNVNPVTRPNAQDLLSYSKRIVIEFVASSLTNSCSLGKLGFKLFNAFNKDSVRVYANSFTKVDERTCKAMLDSNPMTITVDTGIFFNQNIPDIFSDLKYVNFHASEPVKITIDLEKPMNLREYTFVPYFDVRNYCKKVRVKLYNDKNRLTNVRVFEYHNTNGDFTPLTPVVNSGNIIFGDYEDITDPLLPPQ